LIGHGGILFVAPNIEDFPVLRLVDRIDKEIGSDILKNTNKVMEK